MIDADVVMKDREIALLRKKNMSLIDERDKFFCPSDDDVIKDTKIALLIKENRCLIEERDRLFLDADTVMKVGCHLLMDHIVKYYHTVHVVFKLLTIW